MPSPWFILRWLVIVAVCALGWRYTWQSRNDQPPAGYRIVPLMQGSKSIGLSLAGVAIDPIRKDIYAVVGGKKSDVPGDFFVLWRRLDGQHYGLTLFEQNKGARVFCQLDRGGKLETVQNFTSGSDSAPFEIAWNAREEAALRSIVQALPPSFELVPQP